MSDTPSTNPPPPPMELSSAASTEGAGQRTDEGKGRIFPCEKCGADLEFHIGAQSLKCPYCSHVKELEVKEDETVAEQDFHAMLESLAEKRQQEGHGEELETAEVNCTSCGATVTFSGTLTSSECAYCGAPTQRRGVHKSKDRVPVDGVLPFQVRREKARDALKKWVTSRWFAPNEFLKRGVDGRFNGVYMPFWTFDSMTANSYRGERGVHYWVTTGSGENKRRTRRTRWHSARGSFQRFFDDVLVCAATGLPKKQVQALEPWPLQKCRPFNQEILAGYLAETYKISLKKGFGEAKTRIDEALRQDVRRRIGGDEQRIHSISTRHNTLTYKHLLLPVWLLTYRYSEKPYRVVVNAATGEVQGERPYSWVKITLAVLAVLAVVIGIWIATQS